MYDLNVRYERLISISRKNKRYVEDNRIIYGKSTYRAIGLLPRCCISAASIRRRIEEYVCSPYKALRDIS